MKAETPSSEQSETAGEKRQAAPESQKRGPQPPRCGKIWRERRITPLDSETGRDAAEPIGVLVVRADAGDARARDSLFSALYHELHRLAQAHLRRSDGNLTLGTTTLLHEAYLDISRRTAVAFPDRHRFLSYASRAMRGLIIDYVRQRKAHKRGGELTFTSLSEIDVTPLEDPVDFERLGDALDELARVDYSLAELVDLKFFCGFTFAEIAAMRGVSERTVQRHWEKARLYLYRSVSGASQIMDEGLSTEP